MKIGTIGTGNIVYSILTEVQKTEGMQCEAVYSRAEQTGRKLADTYGVEKVYTNLDDMLSDQDVDCIYVASPNSLHYEHTKRTLLAGKHVICEKPFVPCAEQARELFALAKSSQLFLVEGVTIPYLPNYGHVREYLSQIGRIRLVLCTFCQYSSKYDALKRGETPNVFNPAFAGGALMDINLYNIHFITELFGRPLDVQYTANLHANGIDTSGIVTFQYPDFLCQCIGAKDCQGENGVQIIGEEGIILISGASSICQRVTVKKKEKICFQSEQEGTPWQYEIRAIECMMRSRDWASLEKRQAETLLAIEVLEKARKNAGILFGFSK